MLATKQETNSSDPDYRVDPGLVRPNSAKETFLSPFIQGDPGDEKGEDWRAWDRFASGYSSTEQTVTLSLSMPERLGNDEIRMLFGVLRDSWKNDTRFLSSGTRIINHPAYQSIIAMGSAMVPFIIEDLRSEMNHWFHALRTITGHVPEPGKHSNMGAMRTAWLNWADEHQDYLYGIYQELRPSNDG